MKFDIVTLFPEAVSTYTNVSILKKAQERELIEIVFHQLRDYAFDKHKTVDDTLYGGGAGMLLKIDPLVACLESLLENSEYTQEETLVVVTSAKGKVFTQNKAKKMQETYKRVIIFCGRYEGMDERFIEHYADLELSIGQFVLTGGELPALILVDVVSRLIPGVLGNEESALHESFSEENILEHPQYTKPEDFRGYRVPEVLLSGHHEEIRKWRKESQKEVE